MTVMYPYEYYLYRLFKETSRLEAQGHDLHTAFQMARQRYGNYHYGPPTPCRARGDIPRARPVLVKKPETEHSPTRANDNQGKITDE
jgi:hypothetical protein